MTKSARFVLSIVIKSSKVLYSRLLSISNHFKPALSAKECIIWYLSRELYFWSKTNGHEGQFQNDFLRYITQLTVVGGCYFCFVQVIVLKENEVIVFRNA